MGSNARIIQLLKEISDRLKAAGYFVASVSPSESPSQSPSASVSPSESPSASPSA